jgi:hypothetical protein
VRAGRRARAGRAASVRRRDFSRCVGGEEGGDWGLFMPEVWLRSSHFPGGGQSVALFLLAGQWLALTRAKRAEELPE